MRVPKSVCILGETYKIRIVKGLAEAQGCDGCLEPYLFLISLDAGLLKSPRALKRTLLHEIGHALAFESGLHDVLPHAALEQFCQAFSGCVDKLKL